MRLPMAKRIIGREAPPRRPTRCRPGHRYALAQARRRRRRASPAKTAQSLQDDLIGAVGARLTRHMNVSPEDARAPFREESSMAEGTGLSPSASTRTRTPTWRPRSTPGALLRTASFPADARAATPRWSRGCAPSGREEAGVEGTGGYGAGLARALDAAGVRVLEVSAPDHRAAPAREKRRDRREQAARAALAGTRCAPAASRCAGWAPRRA